MAEEQQEATINYKIRPGVRYRVFKNTVNDIDYYKIGFTQKLYDGTKQNYYKEIKFKRGVELPNETDIIILQAYENYRDNPKDKYNPISYLTIVEFEEFENQKWAKREAEEKFRDNLYENEEVQITDDFLD